MSATDFKLALLTQAIDIAQSFGQGILRDMPAQTVSDSL
jgi:hypothetical protein